LFYPGTRVQWVGAPDRGGPPAGAVGTVICTNSYGQIGVDWDGFSLGHNLGMMLSPKAESGWWVRTSRLKIICDDDATVEIDPEALFDLVFAGGEYNE
jgi:hypothetical protein